MVKPLERPVRTLPILFLVTVCVISCGRRVDVDHLPSPVTQIVAFGAGLDMFQKDCGRYPTTAEDLAALVTKPADIPEARWHGPYMESIPRDPWGHDYIYRCPGLRNTNRFDLYSRGPDGVSKSGGDDPDDIANWKKPRTNQ